MLKINGNQRSSLLNEKDSFQCRRLKLVQLVKIEMCK